MLLAAVTACTMLPLATPTPTPSPTPSPSPSPTPAPTATPSATPSPTPDAAAIPRFTAAELVDTTIDGMRVRQHPSTDGRVVAGLLPLAATLQVVMGPVVADGFGWYLVADADERDLGFAEAWIAAGYEPEPFLVSTGGHVERSPFVASFADTGDAEYGPISIAAEGDYAIRWVASDPEGTRCTFSLAIAVGSAEPVRAISATIGSDLVPGTLQPHSFDALGVRGEAFATVSSDCAWAFTVVRVPAASPEPTSDS